jgi:hypothetical protein
MRFLATLLFFPLLWIRGFVSFIFGLIGGLATIVLVALAVAGWFLSERSVEFYIQYLSIHHRYLHYWPLVFLTLGVAFGSFMVRYCYDWFLVRLHLFRRGDMAPWRMA